MNRKIHSITMAALLLALGILIPLTFPKLPIPPASFTLASHVPIFVAMFLSPATAVVVCIGTTLGFLWAMLDITIVMRAASHIVFAVIGAFWLKRQPHLLNSTAKAALFAVVLSLIHVTCEVLVLLPFFYGGRMNAAVYESGFFYYLILLVGVGGFVHSMVDFYLAFAVWKPLKGRTS